MYTCMNSKADLAIIGAGAAGMMAALYAAQSGVRPLILEKNEKAGKKIYITGKGRCNLTNDCDLQEFLREVPVNPRFLYAALKALSPQDMMKLMQDAGCPVKVERGRRVFPVSDKASDVTRTLLRLLSQAGAEIRYGAEAEELMIRDGLIAGVRLKDGSEISARAVIVATGGVSYPSTGSTGDGYRFAFQTGHRVIPPSPALIPLVTQEKWCAELMGLSLTNVRLNAVYNGKTVYSELGEMLFTHFGISGPLVLELSCHLRGIPLDALQVTIDLKPGLTPDQTEDRLARDIASGGKKQTVTLMEGLLPKRLAAIFPGLCGVDGQKPCAQITANERKALAGRLKALPLTVRRKRPIEEAVVTEGGVDVREINPSTMASRLIPNLYFAGETLDVSAHTGGYNLHIAFSTGALAGRSAAKMILT